MINTEVKKLDPEVADIICGELANAVQAAQDKLYFHNQESQVGVIPCMINVLLLSLKESIEPDIFAEFMVELYSLHTNSITKN